MQQSLVVRLIQQGKKLLAIALREGEREASSLVIARLDRATQYSRDRSDGADTPRNTGYPAFAFAGYDSRWRYRLLRRAVRHRPALHRIAHQRDEPVDPVHELAVGHGDEQREHHAEM